MNSNIKENLILIQEVATKALQEYISSTELKDRFSGVNYADLEVVDVWVKYSIHDEDLLYGITIDECSPTVYELQEYMVEYLKENLPDYLRDYVMVETEW